MTKILLVAKKRTGLAEDEFFTYWRQVHAPLVARIPGVRRYVINAVMRDASLTTAICDGVSEMWFDTLASLQEGLASEAGRVAAADIRNFCSPASGTVVAEEIDSPVAVDSTLPGRWPQDDEHGDIHVRSANDVYPLEAPFSELERALIDEFVRAHGQDPGKLASLPEHEREKLLADASVYASGKLVEIESRAHLLDDFRQRAPGA